MDEFLDALRQVMELQNEEAAAVVKAGAGLPRFEHALKHARQNRDEAKRVYLLHLEHHGC